MDLLTAHELAHALKLTVDTVWRYTRTGRIPSVHIGARDYRYRLAEVMEALAQGDATHEISGGFTLQRIDPAKLRALLGYLDRESPR